MNVTQLLASILLPLHLGAPTESAQDTEPRSVPQAQGTSDRAEAEDGDALVMRWSRSARQPVTHLAAWHDRNAEQLAEIERSWAILLRRLGGDRPAFFEPQCLLLSGSLERLDEAILLPAPDRLVDLYLRRMLLHLDRAAAACSSSQLFNVVYRLEEARQALAEIRWLLEQRSISP